VVECFLAKEDVAGSTPVSRSNNLNLNHYGTQRLRVVTPRGCGLGAVFCAEGAVPKW
jgi:hypothetical protein